MTETILQFICNRRDLVITILFGFSRLISKICKILDQFLRYSYSKQLCRHFCCYPHLFLCQKHYIGIHFFSADLNLLDKFNATAWDYARNKQLHYCQLIIMSHQRQRLQSNPSTPIPNRMGLSMTSFNGLGNGDLDYEYMMVRQCKYIWTQNIEYSVRN